MASLTAAVVLAAGEGTRLGGAVPKVLTPLWGRPSLLWPVRAAATLRPRHLVVVAGAHRDAIAAAVGDQAVLAHQPRPLGTGDALAAAREALDGAAGPLLVLYGDVPLLPAERLAALLEAHVAAAATVTMLTAQLEDPTGYGRVVRDADGRVRAIVEEKDADAAVRAVREVNTGVWVVELEGLFERLDGLGRDNAKGEVYLTDLVAQVLADGGTVATVETDDPAETLGFNDHVQLAEVRAELRRRILERHLRAGVEIVDPASTFIDADVEIEPGARIHPCTVVEGAVRIAAGCDVGPFARLRTGTRLASGARIGNFTETKQAVVGEGAKANHLTYLGDVTVGAGANIGAGTITANYDGAAKHPTTIGRGAFIGSGTVLVAPSEVADGGVTGAGAVVTRHSVVGPGETWVGVPARRRQPAQPNEGERTER